MAAPNRIVSDPRVMMGKPVIRGTRITVEAILRKLAEGATEADLLDAYPKLSAADIRASLAYGAASVGLEDSAPVPTRAPARRG